MLRILSLGQDINCGDGREGEAVKSWRENDLRHCGPGGMNLRDPNTLRVTTARGHLVVCGCRHGTSPMSIKRTGKRAITPVPAAFSRARPPTYLWSRSSGTAEDVSDRLRMAACKTRKNVNMHECQACHRDFSEKMGFSCPYCGYVNDLNPGTTYVTATDPNMTTWSPNDDWGEFVRGLEDARGDGSDIDLATDEDHRLLEEYDRSALRKKNVGGGIAA